MRVIKNVKYAQWIDGNLSIIIDDNDEKNDSLIILRGSMVDRIIKKKEKVIFPAYPTIDYTVRSKK